jgi:hypothetical protein
VDKAFAKKRRESHEAALLVIRVHLLTLLLPLGMRGVTPYLLILDEGELALP